MAKRQIATLGEEVLREKAKTVTVFDEKLGTLVDDMIETMFDARGVGLAAPQVGILKRVAVVCTDDGETVYELINPVIIKQSGSQTEAEGCLSIPGQSGYVERPKKLAVQAQDRFGNLQNFKITDALTCVAFCHELDHLDGVLYIDKIIADYKPKNEEK